MMLAVSVLLVAIPGVVALWLWRRKPASKTQEWIMRIVGLVLAALGSLAAYDSSRDLNAKFQDSLQLAGLFLQAAQQQPSYYHSRVGDWDVVITQLRPELDLPPSVNLTAIAYHRTEGKHLLIGPFPYGIPASNFIDRDGAQYAILHDVKSKVCDTERVVACDDLSLIGVVIEFSMAGVPQRLFVSDAKQPLATFFGAKR